MAEYGRFNDDYEMQPDPMCQDRNYSSEMDIEMYTTESMQKTTV